MNTKRLRLLVSLAVIACVLVICIVAVVASFLSGAAVTQSANPTVVASTQARTNVTHKHRLTSPTSVSTPTIQQVVDNSWQYNCCGLLNDLVSVEAAYDPSTGQASVYVVATAFWQSPIDVGKAFIYQYEAAIWKSGYRPESVIVTVVYQGNPTGAITATVLQDTASGID